MPVPVSGFVFDSTQEVFNEHFFGVAFEGSDIIFHQGGLNKRNAEKETIFSPEEGSYVYCQKTGNDMSICTDPSGLCKIYVYESGDNWAVSDSFYELCESVKKLGWPLNPDLPSIYSTRIPGWFGDQLLSFNTVFDEISLVPHWEKLTISNRKTEIRTSDKYENLGSKSKGYEETLREHISTSISRIGTLLSDDRIEVIADLSGGIDSRVTASLLINSGRLERFSFFTKPGENLNTDRRIAEIICQQFGASLVHSYPQGAQTLDYSEWRRRCLGIYPPFWFRSDYPLTTQRLGGKAGELYRDFYGPLWKGSAQDFFSQYKDKFPNQNIFDVAKSDFVDSTKLSTEIYQNNVSDSQAHYRSFRNRFHHSQDLTLDFFSSIELIRAFDEKSGEPDETDYSFFHDYIFNVCPELLDIEFDSPEKNLNLKSMSSLPALTKVKAKIGKCYLDDNDNYIFENSNNLSGPNFLRHFISELLVDFEQSASNPIVEEVLGGEYIDLARQRVHSMHETLRLSNARHFKEVNYVITLGTYLSR